jgi:hypothetical protein
MKRTSLVLAALLIFASSLLALPLTATIFKESDRLKAKVDSWNKQCGNKPDYDENCQKKRHALSKELGEFIALVNDELHFLRGPVSPDAPADFLRETEGRRKIMELEARVAMHNLKWLGLPLDDPERKSEWAALESEKAELEGDYAETHRRFDGKWISIPISSIQKISPAPKKP